MRMIVATLRVCMIALFLLPVAASQMASAKAKVQTPINVISANWMTYATDTWTQIEGAPGDTNIILRVSIQYLGNSTISGVSAYLDLDYPFKNTTGGDVCRSSYSESVSPGSSLDLDFKVNIDVGAEAGEYGVKMTLDYLEVASGAGKTLYFVKSTTVNVPVVIASIRYMVIYDLVVAPTSTVPTGNISVAGNMLNVGKVSALNTNVSVTSSILTRPVSIIIGQVDPNIPRPLSARLQVRAGVAPGIYPITISARYSDSYGVNHISQVEVKLEISSPEPGTRVRPPATGSSNALVLLIQILRDLLAAFFGFTAMLPAT